MEVGGKFWKATREGNFFNYEFLHENRYEGECIIPSQIGEFDLKSRLLGMECGRKFFENLYIMQFKSYSIPSKFFNQTKHNIRSRLTSTKRKYLISAIFTKLSNLC